MKEKLKHKNIFEEKSFEFSLEIIKVFKHLKDKEREFVISKQLVRSGTAVGALIREAQNAESKADFIHKLGISQKECAESLYWIDLLYYSDYIKQAEYGKLKGMAEELLRLIRSSILTSKSKAIKVQKS
jgi:four helix bundle protein